ncbi:hypothetical protein [Comamonas sp. GB3 AK4-5]|uniref:hypothetical protein n=1 Tax=Comamonas sp. GB3 AK4-5 TaxID=3231487 RepID=UPI00351E3C0F
MPVPNSIADLALNPADNYPVGTEPVFPNLDNYIRAHAAFIAQLRDRMDAEGLPLSAVMWWGGARTSIPTRLMALDGPILRRADYPAIWAFVSGGGYPMVSDADWLASPLKRASFSSGDGVTTFRLPDLNGKQANSIGAVTVRGDGSQSAESPGQLQDSQNLSHGHTAATDSAGTHGHAASVSMGGEHSHALRLPRGDDYWSDGGGNVLWGNGRGAAFQTDNAGSHSHSVELASAGDHSHKVTVSQSGGGEARMKSATGAWVMRVK